MSSEKIFLILLIPAVLILSCKSHEDDNSVLLFKIDGKETAYPRLSADDKKVLYQTNEKGHWQLAIMDLESGTHTPVSPDAYNNNFPDWSPDNKWIAFTSDRDGNEEIYLLNIESGNLKRITHDPARDIHPYFSPDGSSLLFNSTRGEGTFDVYQYYFSNDSLVQIISSPGDETCPSLSPDAKQVLILQYTDTGGDVVLMNVSTGERKNITNTPSVSKGWPIFGHDNEWIYFSSQESGPFCIYRIKTDGTGQQKLTNARRNEEDARVSVSKDGKWFIYNKRVRNTLEIRSATI